MSELREKWWISMTELIEQWLILENNVSTERAMTKGKRAMTETREQPQYWESNDRTGKAMTELIEQWQIFESVLRKQWQN